MSFSYMVKEELSKVNNLNNIAEIKAELFGYLISKNAYIMDDKIEFITENEFNIERLYKILFKLKINYEPEAKGKIYKAILEESEIQKVFEEFDYTNISDITRGVFLGAGSILQPEKGYHLELLFNNSENLILIQKLCELKNIKLKTLISENKNSLYMKEGDEISKFLAFIGAGKAVLKFEDTRVLKEIKNNTNRKVNCETANLNKIVNASVTQINDINFIIEKKRFAELTEEQQDVANARIEHPDVSLKDLGKYMKYPAGKSGINYRLKKIHEFAEDLRSENKCEE